MLYNTKEDGMRCQSQLFLITYNGLRPDVAKIQDIKKVLNYYLNIILRFNWVTIFIKLCKCYIESASKAMQNINSSFISN